MKRTLTDFAGFRPHRLRGCAAVVLSLALVLGGVPVFPGAARAQIIGDDPPPSLKHLEPIMPVNLAEYVKNEDAAIRLGKVLFWDMQVGSDGLTACASCHFHAGADSRSKNQLNPGMKAGDSVFGNSTVKRASGFKQFGPNYQLKAADFPLHQRQNPERQASRVTRDTNDVVSSQGVVLKEFTAVNPGNPVDSGTAVSDPVFKVTSGKGKTAQTVNVRRVEPVNAPTVINAVYNFANFVDGRANHFFNGINPFGPADNTAGVWVNESGTLVFKSLNGQEDGLPVLDFASLASQATGPPLSDLEMSWRGRTWADVGKKMLRLTPLAQQQVDFRDSVLGSVVGTGGQGLSLSYAALIQEAFHAKFWDASQPSVTTASQKGPKTKQVIQLDTAGAPLKKADKQDPRTYKLNNGKGQVKLVSAEQTLAANEFTLMEANFVLFFAVSVHLYQSTLVSDDTPFDRFQDGDLSALNASAQRGMQVFFNQGRCNQCHGGSLFTNQGIDVILGINVPPGEPAGVVERMGVAQGEAFYDTGFYNIAVRPTAENIGRGGTTPNILTNPVDENKPYPLSFSRLGLLKQDGKLPVWYDPFVDFLPGTPGSLTRVAVDGAQKTPGLRNVELTGPYFRNGGAATLAQVVDFYTRGGDFPAANIDHLDPFIAEISFLQGNEAAQQDLVAFLLALTDERVKYARAPFDHPQLFVPHGQNDSTAADMVMEVPAVGAGGRATPLGTFLNLDPFQP